MARPATARAETCCSPPKSNPTWTVSWNDNSCRAATIFYLNSEYSIIYFNVNLLDKKNYNHILKYQSKSEKYVVDRVSLKLAYST